MMVMAALHLRLFIAGDEPNSKRAKENLAHLCSESLQGNCTIEVIDILKDYHAALTSNIYVTPALKVEPPGPHITIYGNLNDEEKVLSALGMKS
jgi:circadian clock protein KaiB